MKKLILILAFIHINAFAGSGKLLYSKGNVELNGKKALTGQLVSVGQIISTGRGALAILTLDDGSKIKVNENSRFRLDKIEANAPSGASLLKGSSFIKVLKKKLRDNTKSSFTLRTKSVAMGVRGTEFFASYGKGKRNDVWMCVNEGKVLVKSNSEKKATLVKEGEGVKIDKGQSTSTPKPLAWTKKLNWNMDPSSDVLNKVDIEAAYTDLLDQDYD